MKANPGGARKTNAVGMMTQGKEKNVPCCGTRQLGKLGMLWVEKEDHPPPPFPSAVFLVWWLGTRFQVSGFPNAEMPHILERTHNVWCFLPSLSPSTTLPIA